MKLPPENSDCTSDLSQWFHCSNNRGIPDEILTNASEMTKNVSFVFHHRSAKQEVPPEPEKKQKKAKKIVIGEDSDFSEPDSNEDSDEDYRE